MLRRFFRPAQPATPTTAAQEMPATAARGRSLRDYGFAALDLETTGLFPQAHDRVVEVGIVLFSLDGGVEGEYETLVNPSRDLGAQHIHGLRMADLAHAPSFAEISPDVVTALRSRVIVAHNSRFDIGFLDAEFRRAGIDVPALPHLCTMRLAASGGLGRRLADVCSSLGINYTGSHRAINDARAAAEVLTHWYQARPARVTLDLSSCGCLCEPEPEAWPPLPATGRVLVRSEASRLAAFERGYLARLVAELPTEAAGSPNEAVYLDLLERALEDRYLSPEEAHQLASVAQSEELSTAAVEGLHRHLFESVTRTAWQDGVVSDMEAADLRLVGQFLGLGADLVEAAITRSPGVEAGAAEHTPPASLPAGTTVCFTGALQATIDGCAVTREQAHEFARGADLVVLESVTKKLDVLVVADPQSASGKARKARTYGSRIVAEAVFWQLIGVAVD